MRKKYCGQNCLPQEDIQIHSRSFSVRTCNFRFYRKKRYRKWKIPFCTKSIRNTKKILGNKIIHLKEFYDFVVDYFCIGVISFFSFIKNVFIKIKNSIFPPKYIRYRKYFQKQSCLFQKYLQLWCWLFFLRSYILCLSMKNVIKNENFQFLKKLDKIRKKCWMQMWL